MNLFKNIFTPIDTALFEGQRDTLNPLYVAGYGLTKYDDIGTVEDATSELTGISRDFLNIETNGFI